ncbi:hypothetical protein BDW59DRAFT_156683 [Aspergillus cavernicola]|uniref:Uncharacterized protein n=1 Tax=Aspergillus cavernicola TaxID=176166 RepID=A0ABR4J203_9EURO
MSTTRYLYMYIAMGQKDREERQRHWFLVIAPNNSFNCTFYHATPIDSGYKHTIQIGQSLLDPRIAYINHIGTIPASEQKIVYDLTRSVMPQRCHCYIVSLLDALNLRGLIDPYQQEIFEAEVPPSMFWHARDMGLEAETAAGTLIDAARFVREELGVDSVSYCACFFDT